jgi:hypothetical protein
MRVPQRTQYFPFGGGGIRVRYIEGFPAGVGGGIGMAPGGAEPDGTEVDSGADGAPGAGTGVGATGFALGIAGPVGESPWGRVNPHLGQKRAPSGAS